MNLKLGLWVLACAASGLVRSMAIQAHDKGSGASASKVNQQALLLAQYIQSLPQPIYSIVNILKTREGFEKGEMKGLLIAIDNMLAWLHNKETRQFVYVSSMTDAFIDAFMRGSDMFLSKTLTVFEKLCGNVEVKNKLPNHPKNVFGQFERYFESHDESETVRVLAVIVDLMQSPKGRQLFLEMSQAQRDLIDGFTRSANPDIALVASNIAQLRSGISGSLCIVFQNRGNHTDVVGVGLGPKGRIQLLA
jgi:hypothetical protein